MQQVDSYLRGVWGLLEFGGDNGEDRKGLGFLLGVFHFLDANHSYRPTFGHEKVDQVREDVRLKEANAQKAATQPENSTYFLWKGKY